MIHETASPTTATAVSADDGLRVLLSAADAELELDAVQARALAAELLGAADVIARAGGAD